MPLFKHAMAGSFAVHGVSIQLSRKSHGEIGDVNALLNFTQAFGANFSGFKRDQFAQIIFMFAKLLANLPNNFAALRSGQHAPCFLHGNTSHNGRLQLRGGIQTNRRNGLASCGTFAHNAVSAAAWQQTWMSINSKAFQ